MFSNRRYSFARAVLHGLAILGLVFAAGASTSPAYAAAPPANDNIANSISITTATYSGSITDITGATTAATDPVISCGAAQGHNSVWYTFVPPKSGEASINTLNSQYDTILAVFQNDPLGGLTELGCNDNAGGTTSALSLLLRGGVRYYIEVVSKAVLPAAPAKGLRLSYSFTQKVVAWSTPLGKKWDSTDGIFTFSAGWQLYLDLSSYKGAIQISNNVNNTAVAYFDGGSFDLYYALGPQMGFLDVYVDNVLQVTLGQGNAIYLANQFWSSPAYSDGVHKLLLVHGAGGTKANFDYIQIYSFPDIIPPAKITTLTASTDATTGKVTLKWKAVGDDANVGTASKYKVRYFVDTGIVPNCVADWASGTPYTYGLPTPAIAGAVQQITLTGLVPGLRYYFCIAAVDEVGNMGIPSNRATAIATAGVPYGTGTYDDKHVGWMYTGNWKLVSDPDARYHTLHISRKINNSASFYFTGDQFVFTYLTGPNRGLMDVYIDGVKETTIDQYTYFLHSFYYTSPILAYGPHFVRFVHMTQPQVTVDQIYVWRSNDGGPPDPIVDLAAVPGVNDGEVDLSWTATGDDPGNVGKATKYEVRYSTTPINNLLDWDYAEPAAGVFPVPQPAGNVENVTVIGLTPGAHYYFAVRSFDNAWYDVLSNTVDSDVTYTGVYAAPGFFEDDNPIWFYNGSLWRQIGNINASASHFHWLINAMPGSSARFWFTGTQFKLFFQKNVDNGKLDVYVDGVMRGTINQEYEVILWNQTYLSPVFAAGNHVVEFRIVGKRATIDRIRIWP
jgi:hypothetical protein